MGLKMPKSDSPFKGTVSAYDEEDETSLTGTLRDLVKGLSFTGRGLETSVDKGPVRISVKKDIREPVQGSVTVGRNPANQLEVGYDRERGAFVKGKKSFGWGNK